VEVEALHLDAGDVPADSVRDDEVVRKLVVVRVESGLEVLRARAARRRVVVLVIENVACRRSRGHAQREERERDRETSRARQFHSLPLTV
jgi:hypothetical protein